MITLRMDSSHFGAMDVHVRKLGSGRPLLLVHGFMTTSYSWRYALEPLARHFTCYAPDLPGAGRSDKPLGPSYEPPHMATWIAQVQQALGIYGCAAIGNSMGGYLCMHLALQQPQAMSSLVVLHAPGVPELRLGAARAVFRVPGSRRLLRWLVQRDPLRWVHRNVHYYDESLKSLEEAREYGEPLRSYDGAEAFGKHLRETMGVAAMKRFNELLASGGGQAFPVPILLLYARQDPMVSPSIGVAFRRLIPRARLEWLDEASHFAHVDSVDQFARRSLAFLQRG